MRGANCNIDDYPLQITHPSVFDTGRVPPGRGLVKIEGTMPYALKQGPEHWDEIKEEVAAAIMARYMAHTANITADKILAKMLFSPLDIERKNSSMWRGSVHGFDNRPGNFAPYRLPIPGLYQTGDLHVAGWRHQRLSRAQFGRTDIARSRSEHSAGGECGRSVVTNQWLACKVPVGARRRHCRGTCSAEIWDCLV